MSYDREGSDHHKPPKEITMKQKQTLLLLSVTVLTFLVLSSCEEKTGESEYNDWENRNKTFIDSIAKVASTNADNVRGAHHASESLRERADL